MCASFNGKALHNNHPLLQSTNAWDETEIITFYNELSSLVKHIPKHNVLIISIDMSAQIGKDENNKFCLPNSPNRNMEFLADFSIENRLVYLDTKF